MAQVDPPTDPAAFVHRIGRTARAGQAGKALVLLLPHEDGYLPFLEKRGIDLQDLNRARNSLKWLKNGLKWIKIAAF